MSLAASQLALPRWKQVQSQLQAFLNRQDLGPYLDKLLAAQPLGPVTRAPLTKIGIQDTGVAETRTQMMNMHEVPSSYCFPANNATQACPHGLKKKTLDPSDQPAKGPLQNNPCASIQITRMAGDSKTICATVGYFGRSREPFSLSMTVKVQLLFQPLISAPRYSTCLIAGSKLECQFSELPRLVMITVIVFS